MQTFNEYLNESNLFETCYNEVLSEEDLIKINMHVDHFLNEVKNKGKDPIVVCNEMIEEGIFGSILGGLTGYALGKAVGEIVARTLGIEKGVLYDMLTSRLVGAALGSSLGKRFF